jgi:hypothetical protein
LNDRKDSLNMTRLIMILAGTAAAAAGSGFLPTAALAQSNNSLAEIVVFGTDPCPRSTDDQIVICRRMPEGYRYRLPESYRKSGNRQQTDSWANKARALETVGNTGINSCSPVGPAGYTGCLSKVIREAREQRREETNASTPPEQ